LLNDRLENIKFLIDLGANLAGNGTDRSLLMCACQLGMEEAVHLLIEAGAPVNDTEIEEWTPLSLACRGVLHTDHAKAKRIAKYLWSKGARLM
jgi:ankyrin repeat protein